MTRSYLTSHWAADHVSLDEPWAVASLLRELRAAGASEAVAAKTALATWAATAGMFYLFLEFCPDEAPTTCSGASQTEPHGNPGDGKSRPVRQRALKLLRPEKVVVVGVGPVWVAGGGWAVAGQLARAAILARLRVPAPGCCSRPAVQAGAVPAVAAPGRPGGGRVRWRVPAADEVS